MSLQHKIVSNESEFAAFKEAVKLTGLPHKDLNYQNQILISYFYHGETAGTGGLEVHDRYALLRSVSVSANHRNKSIGKQITTDIIENARNSNLEAVYLLTETAGEYFKKLGFETVGREQVPEEIKSTSEFALVCPASATCMVLNLNSK